MGPGGNTKTVSLGEFIVQNMEEILTAWETFARTYWKGQLPSSERFRDDAQLMLQAVVKDMASFQSDGDQKIKSEGGSVDAGSDMHVAALSHALGRVNDGFDITRMVAEFRALRASVCRIWRAQVPSPSEEQTDELARFHESIDQLVAASVGAFTERIENSRRLFLGILGHDLRQPLNAIKMFSGVLASPDPPSPGPLAASMGKCCDDMARMLADLLDYTSSQLGCALPMYPVPTNLGEICGQVIEEIQVSSPTHKFNFEMGGELDGEWDAVRVRQMVSNLLANAVHHGSADHPIAVKLIADEEDVTLAVHNMGPPIPVESIGILFHPMVRASTGLKARPHGSIGLGLFICRQVAIAHGGEIKVDSSSEGGTAFTVRLPKDNRGQEPGVIGRSLRDLPPPNP